MIYKKIFSIFLFIFLLTALQTETTKGNDAISIYTNIRIHPSTTMNQVEPSIVRHPTNPLIMFATAYTIRSGSSFRSEGVYVTTDGGLSWFGNDTCTGTPIQNHGGDPGPVIDKDGRFILTHQGGISIGMYANWSTDFGVTWSPNYTIATGDQDKGSPNTDDVASSIYYGRTYLVWTKFSGSIPIVISYTSNGGYNWSSVIQVNTSPSGHQSLGGALTVGPSGQVYATWASALQSAPFTENFIGFAVSTNGGVNWNVTENAYDCNGIKTSSLSPWNIRVNGYPTIDVDKSGGPRNGWIYIAESEKNLSPAGSDPDVIFHRSTDGGISWSAGIRVNQDALNNGKVQIFPAMRVDESGGINILYFDNRNGTDSMQTFISRSTDGGDTWSDYVVSDHKFRPKPVTGIGAGNQGDNIGITSGNGKIWPVWMDDYSGLYQIWTASIDINSIGIKTIGSEIPETFTLYQNYPNPFNPKTKIRFSIASNVKSKESKVKLIIFDILGKEVTTLVNQQLNPGTYEIEFNEKSIKSGLQSDVYFYQLSVFNGSEYFSETKRMILVK